MLASLTRIIGDRSVGSLFFGNYHLMDFELMGGDARAAIKTALSQAFVYGFRVIMLVCAGLSMASAGMAWRMIGDQRS